MTNFRRQQKKQKLQSDNTQRSMRNVLPPESGDSAPDTSELLETLEIPSLYQPSRILIWQQCFMSNFISLHPHGKSTTASFCGHMPQFLSDSTTRPLERATMAVVTNYYGTTTHDKYIQIQSRVPYVAALKALQNRFLRTRPDRAAGIEDVSTSILLFIYELRTGETNDGWICHARGAERLFLQLRPEVYQVGPPHDAARFLRYIMVSPTLSPY